MMRPTLLLLVLALLTACSASLPDEALIRQTPPGKLTALLPSLEQRVQSHPTDDEALRRLALLEARLGRGDAAVEHALRAVQASPFVGANQVVLGEAFEAAGKPVRALAAYAQAIELSPNLIGAYVRYAQVLASLHENDKALHALDEALRREPKHFGALLLQARVLRDTGKLDKAAVAIEAARALRPDDAQALLLHVQILQARGQTDAALRLAQDGLTRHPDARPLLTAVAGLHRQRGEWDAALQTLQRLAGLGSLAPDERLLRVEVLAGAGRAADAQAALDALLRDHPDYAPAHVRQAESLVWAGKPREALREAQQASALAPQSGEAHYWEAVAHYALDERPLGDAALAVADHLDPHRLAVELLQAERLLADHRLDVAASVLDVILKQRPDLSAALLLQSARAVLGGDLDLAAQVLERLPPTFAPDQVRFAQLRIAYVQRRWADVLSLSEPLLQDPWLGWRAAYLRGAALLRQGRFDEGLALVTPYLEGAQRRVLFYHLAGYLHLLKGDRTGAQRAFVAGLALAPGSPLMIEGLSRMAMEAQDWARAEQLLQQGLTAPDGFRALFLDRLTQVGQARKSVEQSREALQRYLEVSDPARAGAPPEPASTVLYGAYVPPYDLQ
ncbi:MAG TPA: tetratricopeptide repeat protein [bacterium]|nr:tetratricopeptide repeat protein [bacterium]